ncbi:MAG TPA: glycoside hydrolase family 2 TIM barrel-domain containing protein, partial [Humisphaera sp.]|nr:glycoside hydrolase family 2 TIM barrel-domain containing protein [Humisphaera sp.]
MKTLTQFSVAVFASLLLGSNCAAQTAEILPPNVKPVWSFDHAWEESTPTRERICINGLWRWQPADGDATSVPTDNWGYFKVPGAWPGITDYMQKDSQTLYSHPSWKSRRLGEISAAWYEREIQIPAEWKGRQIALSIDTLNSFATVFVDGAKVGQIRFPAGQIDLSAVCKPGGKHLLSILVVAMPLKGVMLSYTDTANARQVKGTVARRGLCGDVYLVSTLPISLADLKVETSFRKGELTISAAVQGAPDDRHYKLLTQISKDGKPVTEFTSDEFSAGGAGQAPNGRRSFTFKWKPDQLWDLNTPQNQFDLKVSLLDSAGKVIDTSWNTKLGFRELWIDGRDFYLNGTRLFLSSVPIDNAQIGAALANYQAVRMTLHRLKAIGINMVYTHNYDCTPGAHLSFEELLRAADDEGMLVSLTQPHFSSYEWQAADADISNGYARDAAYYASVAGNHPSVVFYSTSHNATGYDQDMNPDLIDGIHDPREAGGQRNVKIALRAEAIIHRVDPTRIVYHHAGGNIGSMHTINFYPNFAPIQELCDWFGHWASEGVKPLFLCEYGAPFSWDWTMYRGWYQGKREWGSAVVPWEFCLAEWDAQFFGDRAFAIGDLEKANLRWEAKQYQAGRVWHRWDYPTQVGLPRFEDRNAIMGMYIADNWRAYRTWGVSGISPWEYEMFWTPRDGVHRKRKQLPVDWDNLQRPGISADYIDSQFESVVTAFDYEDWNPTAAGLAVLRNNMPVLAYIAGGGASFTSKDHNYLPGQTA